MLLVLAAAAVLIYGAVTLPLGKILHQSSVWVQVSVRASSFSAGIAN